MGECRAAFVGLILAVSVLLGGCTGTPYQAEGLTGGYTDAKIDDNTWAVKFGGNGFSTIDEVFIFWLYRCAEITVQEGYMHFVRLDRSAELSPSRKEGGAYRWAAPALATQPPATPVKGGGYIFVPMYYDRTPKPSVQGVIRLYREGDLPEIERPRAYDARRVMREHAGRVKRPVPPDPTAPTKQEDTSAPKS